MAAITTGSPPSWRKVYAMLPAQPPNSRRKVGTRNETFRMCSCSGRICCANLPGNVVMVSNAKEPQINAGMQSPKGSGVENFDGEAVDTRRAGRQRCLQRDVGARRQRADTDLKVARREHPAREQLAI